MLLFVVTTVPLHMTINFQSFGPLTVLTTLKVVNKTSNVSNTKYQRLCHSQTALSITHMTIFSDILWI